MADLTTLENVRAYLSTIEATDQAHDTLLARLIASASLEFERKIGWSVLAAPYTDLRDGDGGRTLWLAHAPVPRQAPPPPVTIADDGVKVDGVVLPKRADPAGSGWVADGGRVRLVGYAFARGTANVEIAYTCGYTVIPADIEQAVIEAVVLLFQRRKSGAANAMSLAGGTVDFRGPNEMFAHAQDTVARYRAIGIG
jgi:hypothetical protein